MAMRVQKREKGGGDALFIVRLARALGPIQLAAHERQLGQNSRIAQPGWQRQRGAGGERLRRESDARSAARRHD